MRDPDPVGTHGSSLSKAKLVRADPSRDKERCILKTHRVPFAQLGDTGRWPFSLRSVGRQLRDAPTPKAFGVIICISRFEAVPRTLLPFKTRPTWVTRRTWSRFQSSRQSRIQLHVAIDAARVKAVQAKDAARADGGSISGAVGKLLT